MKVDNSTLRAVARCTTEAVWRYVLGYTSIEEGAPLRAGSAVHEALDMWGKNGGDKRLGLAALYSYKQWADEHVQTGDRLGFDNVRAITGQWMDDHPPERLPFHLERATFETEFTIPLIDDIEFAGRLDGIVHNKVDNRWYVLEHKTTGHITSYWKQQFQMSSQVTGYIEAASIIKGEPVVGAYINAIELSSLPGAGETASYKCTIHKVPRAECRLRHVKGELIVTQRNPQQRQEWRETAIKLAKRFRKLRAVYGVGDVAHLISAADAPQEGLFHGACTFCTFAKFCQAGRRLDMVESLLVKEPWEVIQ